MPASWSCPNTASARASSRGCPLYTESQADGAGGVVVAVRQAPATCPAILSGTSRARCLRSPRLRASAAERNWSIYGKIKPKVSPRSARSSGATPRPTSLEARLLLDKAQDAGYRAPVWRSGTPTPTRTRAMTRRGSWCRGEAVEAGRLAVSAGGAQDGKRCGGRQGAAS